MATGQTTVVVMANTTGAPEGGATSGGQQQVVVVQQPNGGTGGQSGDGQGRYPRWPYLVFAIGFWLYHFLWTWYYLLLSFAPGGYGALFFFCGLLPALISWVWVINDGTVFCANPGSGPVVKMCCCECINGYIMAVPMAIAALLRLILWFALFGIVADFINSVESQVSDSDTTGSSEAAADEVTRIMFWIFLSVGTLDVGPLILLAIDWWWYYGKFDYDALFGNKIHPLRCAVGESIVIAICSWALIAVFDEYVDDVAEYIWPWILHGTVSTAILIFAAFLQFSGSVKDNKVSNGLFKIVCWALGIALGVLILIVWGYFLSWAFDTIVPFAILLVIYGLYYSGITVPTVWALFSFEVGDTANQGV